MDDRQLLARALIVIWITGTSTFTACVLVAPPPRGHMTTLWSVSAVGYAMSAFLVAVRRQLPGWAPDLSGYLCFTLASVVVAASSDPTTPYAHFYLWVTVVSCHFQTMSRALPQMLVVPAGYGVALASMDARFPFDRWAILNLTVLAVGLSVAAMRSRTVRLVALLDGTAHTDALTGLLNRRAFDKLLVDELERAQRNGGSVALVIADLDHFKSVNDQLGHPAGDDVLRRAAGVLSAEVRRVEGAFRIGGEEFAVIMPGGDGTSARLLAERIRADVDAALASDEVPVTISLGVAAFPSDAADAPSLFAAADSACYLAKAAGRDRTVLAGHADAA